MNATFSYEGPGGASAGYGYAEYAVPSEHGLVVPGTASGDRYETPTTLAGLMREGLLLLPVLFFGIALPSLKLGHGYNTRAAVFLAGMVCTALFILLARTLGGRVFSVLAFSVFFEGNYAFQSQFVVPSTLMLLAVLLLEQMRRQPDQLTVCDRGMRSSMAVLLCAMIGGMALATATNLPWLSASVRGLINIHIPAAVFGIAGYKMLRKGSAGVFLTLLPFLAVADAGAVWLYHISGLELLFYRTGWKAFARYGGFLRNPNFSGFFVSASALLAFVRIRASSHGLKMVLVLAGLFLLGTLVMFRSRGPVVMLAMVTPFVLLRKRLRVWGFVVIILAGVGYMQFGHLLHASQVRGTQTIWERLADWREGARTRLAIQRETLRVTFRYPLGTGQTTGILRWRESAIGAESHNEYLTFTLQNGYQSVLAAGLLVLYMFGGYLRAAARKQPHRPGLPVKLLVLCFLLTFVWQPVFTRASEMAMLFGATFGMFVASLLYAQPQGSPEDEELMPAYEPAYEGYGGT